MKYNILANNNVVATVDVASVDDIELPASGCFTEFTVVEAEPEIKYGSDVRIQGQRGRVIGFDGERYTVVMQSSLYMAGALAKEITVVKALDSRRNMIHDFTVGEF